MTSACSIRVRGVVQGVGFRPFVYRLARENTLAGWVLNEGEGVEIHLEGADERLHAFVTELREHAPTAASIATIEVEPASATGSSEFVIRESRATTRPTTRISPDLAVCDQCVSELFDPADPRCGYPYINCTECGPRYSIIHGLPYDRASTTMAPWPMDALCADEYRDPSSRRFHAQPVACAVCGPAYWLRVGEEIVRGDASLVIRQAAALLREGRIVAVKGIGGFHLACDARSAAAVAALRERKFRKEKPFAVMVRDIETARALADVSPESAAVLASAARPIVLVPARTALHGVAPGNDEIGIMLPYTPLHHLLFAAGAPATLVMTSANRSSEPIAYEDADALESLAGIADAFLIGERPIARRVEDSVARVGALGPVILRRGRGYAPGAVATIPTSQPILALGADLKNAIALVVEGQAFVSQHIGDLEHYAAHRAFRETVRDLLTMYRVPSDDLVIAHDAHPQYRSTAYATEIGAPHSLSVQHHRAHIASVLAERGAWEQRVLGIALDGTGYGDDGSIWGGELFVGSVVDGLERVAHLRPADLVGGDAAARHPVQAAAGFVHQLVEVPDLMSSPFDFPRRYADVLALLRRRTRTFDTTSMGRLFDTAAALLGFVRPVSFEGQAAIWLEQLARTSGATDRYPFPFDGRMLDFRPLLLALVHDRASRREVADIARAFHLGIARGLRDAAVALCESHALDTVVASGGVFQNELLMGELASACETDGLRFWINHAVPPNDGGIALGQAAIAALGPRTANGAR